MSEDEVFRQSPSSQPTTQGSVCICLRNLFSWRWGHGSGNFGQEHALGACGRDFTHATFAYLSEQVSLKLGPLDAKGIIGVVGALVIVWILAASGGTLYGLIGPKFSAPLPAIADNH